MSELQSIESVLTQTARRQHWQRARIAFWNGVLLAGGVWLLALALYKLFPLPLLALAAAGIAGLSSSRWPSGSAGAIRLPCNKLRAC